MRALVVTGLGLVLLSGCTASTSPSPAPDTPTAVEGVDVEACVQFGDVLTLIYNESVAFQEGRASQQEMDGALRLATRILHRIEADPATPVGIALTDLKRVATEIGPGAMFEPFDADGEAWNDAYLAMSSACTDAGSQLAVSAWTGG